jgi:hypothetical protein
MNDETERMWKKESRPNLSYYTSVRLDRLRKVTKTVTQDTNQTAFTKK